MGILKAEHLGGTTDERETNSEKVKTCDSGFVQRVSDVQPFVFPEYGRSLCPE